MRVGFANRAKHKGVFAVASVEQSGGIVPFMATTDKCVRPIGFGFVAFIAESLMAVGVQPCYVYRWFEPFWEN